MEWTGSHYLEQAMIRPAVPCNGRPHQPGPFVFTFAHARSHTAIRSIFQFVTPGDLTHEVVIVVPGGIAIVAPGPAIAAPDFALEGS